MNSFDGRRPVLLLLTMAMVAGSASHALGQRSRHTDVWNFGNRCRLTWTADASALSASVDPSINTGEGCASFADPRTGDLLVYSDGRSVWDADGTTIASGLLGHSSSLHSAVIVPRPITPNRLFVITHSHNATASVAYREIDVTGGTATSVGTNVSVNLDGGAANGREGMVVIPHTNGFDYWVLISGNNAAYVLPVTASGIGAPTRVDTGVPLTAWGIFAASNAGDRLMIAGNQTSGPIVSFDFDAATGTLSGRTVIRATFDSEYYGGAFSPDDSKFYFSTLTSPGQVSRVYQYDFDTDTMTMLDERGPRYTNAQARLGPDGKIYVATGVVGAPFVATLSVIDNPNLAGVAAGFRYGAVPMAAGCDPVLGLPQTVSPRARLVFGIDVVGPSGTIATPSITPEGTANVPDGTDVSVTVTGPGGPYMCSATVMMGRWSCSIPITGLAPGNYVTQGTVMLSDSTLMDSEPFEVVTCIDDAAGIATDTGCTTDSPLCDESGLAPVCVSCLADEHCPAGTICGPSQTCTMGCRDNADCAPTPMTPVCDTAAEACVECVANTDCDANEVCSPERTCVGCNTDADCDGELVCDPVTDTCAECVGDADCPEGLVCEGATCTPECRTDGECADPGQPVCDAGVCVGCTRDTECPSAMRCVARECSSPCTRDDDCTDTAAPVCDTAHQVCVECTQDSQCPSNQCDEVTRTCIPSCSDDSNCRGTRPTCSSANLCVECDQDDDCAPDATCDEGRGRCVECTDDTQCLAGERCTDDNTCVGCTDDGMCGGALMCDPDLMSCEAGCMSDQDCDNPRLPRCEPTASACVECLGDGDCGGTEVCTQNHRCEPPCTTDQDCPTDTVCNAEAGRCEPETETNSGLAGGALCAVHAPAPSEPIAGALLALAFGMLLARRRSRTTRS